IVRSLFTYVGQTYTNEELLALANISETYAHGAPSGIDSLTITSPSPIWYEKNHPIDHIGLGCELYVVVADKRKMADTKNSVNTVKHMLKMATEKLQHKIERIGEITYQTREALEKKSKQVLGFFLN